MINCLRSLARLNDPQKRVSQDGTNYQDSPIHRNIHGISVLQIHLYWRLLSVGSESDLLSSPRQGYG